MESKLVLHTKTRHINVYAHPENVTHLTKEKMGTLNLQGGTAAYVKQFIDGHNQDESAHPYIQESISELEGMLDGKQDTISDLETIRSGAALGATAVQPGDLATVATTGDYDDLTNKPTIPSQASDVHALPDTTKYGASLDLDINSSTYVVTARLKDQDGNTLGTAQTIDLPLESVVVNGSYDSANKKVVLTLQNGSTVEFSVADLVAGLQSEITSSNKLSADLVDDTNTAHKFVTASEKSTWNGKQDAISDLATIRSGAAAGATALQPSVAASTYATKAEIADQYTESNLVPRVPVSFEKAQVSDFYNVVGSPIIVDGVVSNFSLSSYVQIPAFMPGNKTWALQLKFKLNSSMTNSSALFNDTSNDFRCPKISVIPGTSSLVFRAFVSTTGSSWNVSNGPQRSVSFDYSKWAYILWEFTGSQYILSFKQEGQDYSIITTINSTEPFYQNQNQVGMSFGNDIGSAAQYNSYIDGSIDLNETYIKVNGKYFVPPLSSTIVSVSSMTGATSSAAGSSGLVPAPAAGDEAKFLRGDGTWVGSTSAVAWGSLTGTLSDQTDLQNALNGKQGTITGGATSIVSSDLTASKALVSDGNGKVGTSSVTSTELGYVSGVTSSIQTQLNSKAEDSGVVHLAGTETIAGAKTFSAAAVFSSTAEGVTPGASDDSTKFATTAWVRTLIGGLNMLGRMNFSGAATVSVSSRSSYTCPSDGYLLQSGSSSGTIKINNISQASFTLDPITPLPVSQGDSIAQSVASNTPTIFRFIPQK